MIHSGFRADINGLRAVAVLSVILFHFSEIYLPGGYLGVDIFFVISGYLITGIIAREFQHNTFSIMRFYERRIRRIMPALLIVLASCTVVAGFVLLPSDLVGYAESLMATLGFVSNVYFWRDTNYFSPNAATKPLLHMWSLAVEEQFYVFYPLVLAVLLRYLKKYVFFGVLFLFTLSYGLYLFLISIGGESPAFFMFPTRAWQLCIGAMLALISIRSFTQVEANVLSVFGAGLVALSLVWPNSSVHALLPTEAVVVVGTGLIILAGSHFGSTYPAVNRLLGTQLFASLGTVSYSLYLWHWPVIVFWSYYNVDELSVQQSLLAFCIMLSLAYASTHLIELPLRKGSFPIRRLINAVVASVGILLCLSILTITYKGFPARLNTEAASINAAVDTNYRCAVSDFINFGSVRACSLNLSSRSIQDAEFLLLGNSHAQMYAPLWSQFLEDENIPGLLVPQNGCLPTTTLNLSLGCIDRARYILDKVKELSNVKVVAIGFNWDLSLKLPLAGADGTKVSENYQKHLQASLDALIDELGDAGKSVILTGPIAVPYFDVASDISRRLAFGHDIEHTLVVQRQEFDARFASHIDYYSNRADIGFVRPHDIQCDDEYCYFIKDEQSFFADSNHLAAAALSEFETEFLRVFNANLINFDRP